MLTIISWAFGLSPSQPSLELLSSSRHLLHVLLPSLHPSSQKLVSQTEGWTIRPILPTFWTGTERVLVCFVRLLSCLVFLLVQLLQSLLYLISMLSLGNKTDFVRLIEMMLYILYISCFEVLEDREMVNGPWNLDWILSPVNGLFSCNEHLTSSYLHSYSTKLC